MLRSLIAVLASTPLFLSSGSPAPQCSGCNGVGGGGGASSGGSSVSISAIVSSGKCKPAQGTHPPTEDCALFDPCRRTVVRTWSGAVPNAEMLFCRILDDGTLWCKSPAPSTGSSGSGFETRTNTMSCGTAEVSTMDVPTPGGGLLSAEATSSCSECP